MERRGHLSRSKSVHLRTKCEKVASHVSALKDHQNHEAEEVGGQDSEARVSTTKEK